MSSWDLATRGNWELLITGRQEVVYKNGTTSNDRRYRYDPLPPTYVTATTHTILVGVLSVTAYQHWFLGARVSQYLYVSPSPTVGLLSGVKAEQVYKAQLGRLSLIEFKNYNVVPYVIELDFPYWLEDVYFEVWQYNGIVGTGEQPNFTDLTTRLDNIAQQLAALEQYST